MNKQVTVVVRESTPVQGAGWAVEVYGTNGVRTTSSRWTTQERAIREAKSLTPLLNANLVY